MGLVFVDANVLHSKTLRDWTLLLSKHCNRFAVVSSQDCIVEALASIRERHPHLDGGAIRQISDSIDGALHDVIDDWRGGAIEGMPDEKDWHVVHAATHAQVEILVTENMKDFAPIAETLPFDLYTPDELFMLIAHNDPEAVENTTREQVDYWHKIEARRALAGQPAPKRMSEALRDARALEFADVIDQTLRKLASIREDVPSAGSGESGTPRAANREGVGVAGETAPTS